MALSDLRPEAELQEEIKSLAGLPIDFLFGSEKSGWLDAVDCVVPSPGVAAENPLIREAGARKIAVLSEIELAYRFFRAPVVALTGTNGKSTTTTLIGEMLKAGGRKVFRRRQFGNAVYRRGFGRVGLGCARDQ